MDGLSACGDYKPVLHTRHHWLLPVSSCGWHFDDIIDDCFYFLTKVLDTFLWVLSTTGRACVCHDSICLLTWLLMCMFWVDFIHVPVVLDCLYVNMLSLVFMCVCVRLTIHECAYWIYIGLTTHVCVCWFDCPRICLWLWLFRYVSVRLLIHMCVFWSDCPCTFLLDWNSHVLVCGVDFSCVCLLCLSFTHVHVAWLPMPLFDLPFILSMHESVRWTFYTCVSWFAHSCVCLLDWSYICVSVRLTLHECVCWVGSVCVCMRACTHMRLHTLRLFYYHIPSVS